jgi:topoisomerase-4 subunit A
MGMLFRNSDLEVRFSLNMNVLIDGRTPKVCSLKEVLRAFLDHRRDVLIRRSQHRMAKIDHRLEVLEGFIIAFLNLDRVIDIIRYDDDAEGRADARGLGPGVRARHRTEADYVSPPPGLTASLTEVQAEAILNMRLRSLRRLEELELLRERDALMEERAELDDLLVRGDAAMGEDRRGTARGPKSLRRQGPTAVRAARSFAEAGEVEDVPLEAMIDREPVTVVCSQMGWIRAMKGHIDLTRELKFRDGDGGASSSTPRPRTSCCFSARMGRFYTLSPPICPAGAAWANRCA